MTTGQNAAAFLVLLAAAGAIAFPAAAEDAKPTADPTKSEQMSRERAMKSAQKIVDTFRSKKRGASLGMTVEQVLLSTWGKPKKINETITGGGHHEQWVYPGDQYLYFENGILTSIQTHR